LAYSEGFLKKRGPIDAFAHRMAMSECALCGQLFEIAEAKIREHLEATTKATAALVRSADLGELDALEEALAVAAEVRAKAVAEYRRHRDQHAP